MVMGSILTREVHEDVFIVSQAGLRVVMQPLPFEDTQVIYTTFRTAMAFARSAKWKDFVSASRTI
jgi:hypothetical protein